MVHRPRSTTTFKKHLLAKLTLFRCLNTTSTVSASLFSDQRSSEGGNYCYLNAIGTAILLQLCSDWGLKLVLDLAWPRISVSLCPFSHIIEVWCVMLTSA